MFRQRGLSESSFSTSRWKKMLMISEFELAYSKEKYTAPVESNATIIEIRGLIWSCGTELVLRGRHHFLRRKSAWPIHDSSTLMITFLLRSIFRNSSANCYLSIKFFTEFAVIDIGLIFLNFIPRLILIILCTSLFLQSSWCSSRSFVLIEATESRNESFIASSNIFF